MRTRQTDKIKSEILKQSWNVERLVEHIRQNVAWELIGQWWLEWNVWWMWNVSTERWREAARRFWNAFEEKYWCKNVMLADILFIYIKSRKLDGEKFLFILPTQTYFGNNLVSSDQNCNFLSLFTYADRYIISNIRRILLPPTSSSGGPTLQAVSNSQQIPKKNNVHQQRCTKLNGRQSTFHRTYQFQTLAQPSLTAAQLPGNQKLTGSLYWASPPRPTIQVSCLSQAQAALYLEKNIRTLYPGGVWGLQRQIGRFGGNRKHSPSTKFEDRNVKSTDSSVDRLQDFLQVNSSWEV